MRVVCPLINLQGTEVPLIDDDMPVDTEAEHDILSLIDRGLLYQASRFAFSAGALEMLENGEF
jgi:hypothetical protein